MKDRKFIDSPSMRSAKEGVELDIDDYEWARMVQNSAKVVQSGARMGQKAARMGQKAPHPNHMNHTVNGV
jgi:hypothetical protein